MDLGIAGRTALVAAGTKGIGLAIATRLAQEGVHVTVGARHQADLPNGITFHPLDVTNHESLRRWVASVPEPDIVITNTGGPPAGMVDEVTEEQWRHGIESTLINVTRTVDLVAPDMAKRGWGRIVHVTSVAAKEPEPILAISSTLRAGLRALTRLQAQTYAPHGVTVNGVLPGHTMTDRQVHLAEVNAERNGTTVEHELIQRGKSIPIGRLCEPEEIGDAAVFLCSKNAAAITGINLLVDGGKCRGID